MRMQDDFKLTVASISNNVGLTPFKLKPHQRTSPQASAAAQFEATFYQTLMKQLFVTSEEDSIFGNSAQGNFIKTIFLDIVSKMGSSSLGLQPAIEKAMQNKNATAYVDPADKTLKVGARHDLAV